MKILFGISAGISIYKAIGIIRNLVKSGHSIRVVMTENAARMVSPIMFQTISGNDVFIKDFDQKEPLAHIRLGDWADLLVLLPATANTIAKIANGIADNLLTSTVIACDKKKMVFPAMNVKMYENQATQDNIRVLKDRGFTVIDPAYGDLACGYKGQGRLPPEDYIIGMIDRDLNAPLKGMHFIVTAGGTIEKIDPVRYLSNFSSGKMGLEIAKTLFRRGAEVLLIHGNVSVTVPAYLPSLKTESTEDMLSAIEKNIPQYDGLYMAAAPADFKPVSYSDEKIKKNGSLNIALTENPDILKTVIRKFSGKLTVGFALETQDFIQNAKKKIKDKGLDFIVLNQLSSDFNPLGSDMNSVTLISRDGGTMRELLHKSKREVAEWIVEETLAGKA